MRNLQGSNNSGHFLAEEQGCHHFSWTGSPPSAATTVCKWQSGNALRVHRSMVHEDNSLRILRSPFREHQTVACSPATKSARAWPRGQSGHPCGSAGRNPPAKATLDPPAAPPPPSATRQLPSDWWFRHWVPFSHLVSKGTGDCGKAKSGNRRATSSQVQA